MTRLAIDIGGTFTDLVLFDEKNGKLTAFKSLSTPSDPSIGVLNTINLDDGKVVEVRAGQWGGYYLKLGNLTKSVGRGISPKDIDEDLIKEILKEELQILKNNEKEKNINESSVEDNIEDKDDESNS